MSNEMVKQGNELIVSNLVTKGDLSGLSPDQLTEYYIGLCDKLGLNPVTKPFDVIVLNGKKVMYANKECSLQLSKINGISIVEMNQTFERDLCITKVKAQDKSGRFDIATGAVDITGYSGDKLANAIMKSETKGKRRVILSISGLGSLDESELETIPHESPELKKIENKEPVKAKPEKVEMRLDQIKAKQMVEKYVEEGLITNENVKADIRLALQTCKGDMSHSLFSKMTEKEVIEVMATIDHEVELKQTGFNPNPVNPEGSKE
jgi:hypothetical protein